MRKKLKKLKKFWRGFNIVKLLRGYKTIKLTEEEKNDIFLRENWLNTDVMARVIADRTGIPFGIVFEILNDCEYDVMGQVGLIGDYVLE